MIVMVMGPQGSGKSTQAVLLAQKLGLPHLQTGELLRQLAKRSTKLGRKVKRFVEQGKLVNDELLDKILTAKISQPKYQKGFVADGLPRTLSQAQKLPFRIDRVIYLRVSDGENIRRLLLRQRADDTRELIAERLKLYHQQTEPVLNFYRQHGLLIEVDGKRPIEVIHQDILEKL
jgi:adenylate kinase